MRKTIKKNTIIDHPMSINLRWCSPLPILLFNKLLKKPNLPNGLKCNLLKKLEVWEKKLNISQKLNNLNFSQWDQEDQWHLSKRKFNLKNNKVEEYNIKSTTSKKIKKDQTFSKTLQIDKLLIIERNPKSQVLKINHHFAN